jgi:hypothetical protein
MSILPDHQADVELILSKRYDLGWDYWTTQDKQLGKGGAFSTLASTAMLVELGMDPNHPVLREVVDLLYSCQLPDGRFRVYPTGSVYPCHTINAATLLCQLGMSKEDPLKKTFQHLYDIQHTDGGWRCKKFSYGHGPETLYSNPGTTLNALNAFRYTEDLNRKLALDQAVEFLLDHWEIRTPLGPCHYGIGTLFMQVEYPFANYNLFLYVYVLSFYHRAKKDLRFLEALDLLESKLLERQVVVERGSPALKGLTFCKKGQPSILATRRFEEIKENLKFV